MRDPEQEKLDDLSDEIDEARKAAERDELLPEDGDEEPKVRPLTDP